MAEINELLAMEFDLDTAELLDRMEVVGLASDVQGAVIANIILERVGRRQRRFSYSNPVDATADECVALYARTLEHADWVNGEDMVDAEEFNERFHQIEADTDAAARDAATALSCVMGLRAQLARALEEIKGQINSIHGDIFDMRDDPPFVGPRPYPWPGVFDPGFAVSPLPGTGTLGFVPDFSGMTVTDLSNNWHDINPLLTGGAGGGHTFSGQGIPFNGGAQGVWTLQGNTDVGSINGMHATRLSDAEFNGDSVEVWSTPAGMFLTPISRVEEASRGYIDPRVELGGRFNAWVSENAKVIERTFDGEGFTAAELEEKFGSQSIGSGLRVSEALKGFSGGSKFESAANLSERFSERQAERIMASGASVAVKIGAFGIVPGGGAAQDAKIATFSGMPDKARASLRQGGIETIGDLKNAQGENIARLLERAGVPASRSEIASWQGMARVVVGLG